MTIRDIKILSEIIQNKIDLGLQLDISILRDFENQTKIKILCFQMESILFMNFLV